MAGQWGRPVHLEHFLLPTLDMTKKKIHIQNLKLKKKENLMQNRFIEKNAFPRIRDNWGKYVNGIRAKWDGVPKKNY